MTKSRPAIALRIVSMSSLWIAKIHKSFSAITINFRPPLPAAHVHVTSILSEPTHARKDLQPAYVRIRTMRQELTPFGNHAVHPEFRTVTRKEGLPARS